MLTMTYSTCPIDGRTKVATDPLTYCLSHPRFPA